MFETVMCLLAIGVGSVIGLLNLVPGLHISVIVAGLLPLLGLEGLAPSCLVVSALGAGLATSTLAKTFQPTPRALLATATPEQVMAYGGQGRRAIAIQVNAIWVGLVVVLAITIPLALVHLINAQELTKFFRQVLKPVGLVVAVGFVVLTVFNAGNKAATVAVVILGSLLGFVALNIEGLRGNSAAIAPLLAGVFAIPGLLVVGLQRGRLARFPHQGPIHSPTGLDQQSSVWGSLSGMVMAMVAGLGAGSAVATLSPRGISHEAYLAAHTASESANHIYTVVLFVLVGVTHSGTGIALRSAMPQSDTLAGVILLISVILGLRAGTGVTNRLLNRYVDFVTGLPQRSLAWAVLFLTLAIVSAETGFTGLIVAITAATLGLAARFNLVPNQASLAVLTGPVIIGQMGLAPYLGSLLGVLH